MKELKTEKYKGSLLLKISLMCLAAFLVVMLIGQQIQISQKAEQLEKLKQEIKTQNINNDEMKDILTNEEKMREFIEDIARRQYNYAMPDEKVVVNIGGTE